MLHAGPVFKLSRDENRLELCFDTQEGKVNVFNRLALKEFGDVLSIVEAQEDVVGLYMTSSKSVFVAGADITEFLDYFASPDEVLRAMLDEVNAMFNRFEDLPFPTVACINGEAQGGGFEICLAADFRIASPSARMGLPEVKLGIMPGWGGSVRLPRLIGMDNAVEWICTGASKKAADALAAGAIDAVIHDGDLASAAKSIFAQVASGQIDIKARRAVKTSAVLLSDLELTMAIESAKGVVGAKAGPHYPAPMTIISTLAKHAKKGRDDALAFESESFVKLAKSDVAGSLVGIFLNDQALKRLARKQSKAARPIRQTAVLGAGIMGGGVAYQSASNGVPIIMKDIQEQALGAGLDEAGKLLKKQMQRGKLKPEGMAIVLNSIRPALSYGEFDSVDLVVGGFNQLIADGADFVAVDKALERFGWPMGPAYLLDVVGMDTGKHAADVMAEGFPDRMASEGKTIIDALFEAERLGQKNGKGFYRYEPDKRGKPQKLADPTVDAIIASVIASVQGQSKDMDAQDLVDRLMIPMCIESARCLEDNIVSSASEAVSPHG